MVYGGLGCHVTFKQRLGVVDISVHMTRHRGLRHTKGCTRTSLYSMEVMYADPLGDPPVALEQLRNLQAHCTQHSLLAETILPHCVGEFPKLIGGACL